MRAWLYSPILGFTLLCSSCINQSDFEIDSVTLDPTLELPLVHGQLQLTDILNNDDSSHFKTDEDGLLYISYSDELLSEDVRNMFELHDLEVNKSFVLPGMVIPPHNNDYEYDVITSDVDFDLDPEKLNEIALNGGQIAYSVVLTPQSSNLDYEVRLVLDGFKSRTTNQTMDKVIEGDGVIDISDNTITLDDNKFVLKLSLIFKKSSSSTTIAPATSVNISLGFEDFSFEYIKGFLGDQKTSMEPRTTALGFFNGDIFSGADVSFAQPKVSLTVYNENGVPCNVHFVKLEARKDGAAPLSITLNPPNPVTLAFPTVLGDTKATTVGVVNVADLMNYAPSEIFYQADVHINEGLTSGNNFVIDSSAMKVKLNIDVPLWGSASGVVLQDTLDVDLEDVKSSEVESAALKLHLVNQIPLDGNLQFVLTDENYEPLGTLLLPDQTNIIKGSTVGSNGELEAAGEYSGNIEIDQAKIENLFKTKHLILMANLETSETPTDVKFLADYGLTINAKVLASLKLTVE